MALNRLGDFIELVDKRNEAESFSFRDVRGISTSKQFIETKANLDGVNLRTYKIVGLNEFAYVADTSRRGEKIALAFCRERPCIISGIYTVFRVRDESQLLPTYLMMFFNRPEFDRYARFNSWGSARETFSWEDFCAIELLIPPIEIQRKYVSIYESLLANLAVYEKDLDDLKLSYEGMIEKLRRDEPSSLLGEHIKFRNEKNADGSITLEQGINIQKEFISPQRSNANLKARKIVRTGDIAFCTQLNNENVAIAIREGPDCVVSSAYDVFYVKDRNVLNPKYTLLWLMRSEFGRYVYWKSTGTSYEFLDPANIESYQIPIPSIDIQNSIVCIFDSIQARKDAKQKLKALISTVCPLLIRGSIEEASRL